MQISVETLDGLKRKLRLEIPAAQAQAAAEAKARELAKTARVDGFRAGKVPVNVIQKQFADRIQQDLGSEFVRSHLFKAIDEQKLKLAGMPTVDFGLFMIGQPFVIEATFEVIPEFEVNDLTGAKLEKMTATLTDKDVDTMLEKLREQHPQWNEVKRAAKSGDQVIIDFKGTVEGEAFEGNSATDFPLELGSGSMIPGFEEAIIGKKASEKEFTIDVTFPDDYHHAPLVGKNAQFVITLHKVNEATLPELDDAFAEKFNITEGGAEGLRKQAKENMERELQQQQLSRQKQAAFQKLVELNPIDVPEVLVKDEIKRMKQQFLQQFQIGKDMDLPDGMFTEEAKKRVAMGLVISAFVDAKNIEPTDEQVTAKIEFLAQVYEKPEELIQQYTADKDRFEDIRSLVAEDLAVEALFEQADVKEVTQTYEEFMAPPAAPAEEDADETTA